uniref:YidC/Oxa1 family membrane protein insertase n=1 Tax=Lactobacillus jensenii TaxID=109790 RepID=UPI0028703E74
IIVFTILVRLILFPLNGISIKSTTPPPQLQTEIDKLLAKYPGNDAESRQLLTAATQKLYKEAGITAYLGCCPMHLQLPCM